MLEGIDRLSRNKKVIDALERWFWAIENGTSDKWYPDPKGQRYSQEEVDRFVKMIDWEFEFELLNHPDYHAREGQKTRGIPMELPPEFNRLTGASREAFVQDIKRVAEEAFIGYEDPALLDIPPTYYAEGGGTI